MVAAVMSATVPVRVMSAAVAKRVVSAAMSVRVVPAVMTAKEAQAEAQTTVMMVTAVVRRSVRVVVGLGIVVTGGWQILDTAARCRGNRVRTNRIPAVAATVIGRRTAAEQQRRQTSRDQAG